MRDDEYTLLKEATLLIKQDRFDEASQLYQKIGEFFSNKNNFKKSVAAYEKAISLAPHPDLYLSLANVHEKTHHNFSAYEALRKAYNGFTESTSLDKALETGFKMKNTQPDSPVPHECMARIYCAMGHEREASDELKKGALKAQALNNKHLALEFLYFAFKMTPDNKETWRGLRSTLAKKYGAEAPPVAVLDRLIQDMKEPVIPDKSPDKSQDKPESEPVEDIKSPHLFKESPSPEDIMKSLLEDLNIDQEAPSKKPELHIKTSKKELSDRDQYDLAVAYKEMGLLDKAIPLLKTIIARKKGAIKSPLFLDCVILVSMCYSENKNHFEAISALEKIIHQAETSATKIRPNYAMEIMYHLSIAYEQSENLNKALYYLRKIEKKDKRYRDIEDRIRKIRNKIHA